MMLIQLDVEGQTVETHHVTKKRMDPKLKLIFCFIAVGLYTLAAYLDADQMLVCELLEKMPKLCVAIIIAAVRFTDMIVTGLDLFITCLYSIFLCIGSWWHSSSQSVSALFNL
jgi:hypothetical protein